MYPPITACILYEYYCIYMYDSLHILLEAAIFGKLRIQSRKYHFLENSRREACGRGDHDQNLFKRTDSIGGTL
jgi:hypothetical protein